MPSSATNTYQDNKLQPSRHPELALEERYQVTASATIAKGVVVGRVTATGKLAAYASGNADGSQTPVGIVPFAITTDSSGNITVEGGNVLGTTQDTIPVFIGGYFLSADLTGMDSNALTKLGGHLVWGDLTTGEIVIPV